MDKKALFSFCLVAIFATSLLAGCSPGKPSPSSGQSLSSPAPALTPSEASASIQDTSTAAGTSISQEDILRLKEEAVALTEHLVTKVLSYRAAAGTSEISDSEITIFILSLASYLDNPSHPYHNFITRTPELLYIFPLPKVQQIAKELFGRDNWDFGTTINGIDFNYNAEQQQYESGLEFGIGGYYYGCQDLRPSFSPENGTIKVDFILLSHPNGLGDQVWKDKTESTMTFTVESANGNTFLRFASIVPA